jgi:hypothetical protein
MRALVPAATIALLAAPALAGAPDEPVPRIYGGTPVEPCGWPTAVSMQGSCTGTLVHPQVVFYAAHCGSGYPAVNLGENVNGNGRKVATEFCMTNPEFDGDNLGQGVDFAFCKLAQPITDVPIVPILFGCETSILQIGRTVTIVGFGQADNGPYGIKREVEAPIVQLGVEAWVGGGGKSSCSGDSGGPLFIKLGSDVGGDETWRVFGVTSWGQADNCPAGGSFGLMHNGVAWVEENSGVDITPCHDVDGTWNPTPYCRGFPLDPGHGHGEWDHGCAGGPEGDWATLCGPAPDGDDLPPQVQITAPATGTRFDSDPMTGQAAITIVADASDGDGWGIAEVRLVIDGQEVPNGADTTPPYEWPAAFQPGQYVLVARAVDLADHVTDSEPVYFGVDMDAPEPPPEEEGGTDDGGTGGTGGTTGSGDGEPGGCGCIATQAPAAAPLPVLAALARRRRGRR